MAGSAAKDRVVDPLQRWAVNPIVPLEHDLGIPSAGDALLETTGRTGLLQRSPKGTLRGFEWGFSPSRRASVAGRRLGGRSLGRWVCLPEVGQGPPQLSA
jgi:hypothetical protein